MKKYIFHICILLIFFYKLALPKYSSRIVGPTTDLKTHKKNVYDNVTNRATIKGLR